MNNSMQKIHQLEKNKIFYVFILEKKTLIKTKYKNFFLFVLTKFNLKRIIRMKKKFVT